MTNAQTVIGLERQRERIPTSYLMEFEEITNEELAAMSRDSKCPRDWRTFAGWEIDYRASRGVEVYYDAEADEIRRRKR